MQYFDHSTTASCDSKVMALRLEHGGAAVDAYWHFVEHMHHEMRPLNVGNAHEMRTHCHVLCTDETTLKKWLDAMVEIGLFHIDGDNPDVVYSKRAMENFEQYRDKKEKATSAAKTRWAMQDGMQPHKKAQCKKKKGAMPTKQNKTKVSNATKGITNPSPSGDAAAANAAPPAGDKQEAPPPERKPYCPLCGVEMWRDNQMGRYHCPQCMEEFDKGKADWRSRAPVEASGGRKGGGND